jgi:hypothetical protein
MKLVVAHCRKSGKRNEERLPATLAPKWSAQKGASKTKQDLHAVNAQLDAR